MEIEILGNCQITNDVLKTSKEVIENKNGLSPNDFLNQLFDLLPERYAKFHKMDLLCKLAFLGTEFLKRETPVIEDPAIIFSNKYSSLDTDVIHQEKLNNGAAPSPSIFVYTLPNILLGEIAIKNKWHGENLFILAPEYNKEVLLQKAELLFSRKKAKSAVVGWVECIGGNLDLKVFYCKPQ